jgi:GH25 family lysozyme M1 (1,4-beta-N-acetylmuramidase)
VNIKLPCIIDTSHWDVPDWDNLDPRVVGAIMKATQGKYYIDPTFASQWSNAGRVKRPRSAFHFMELNDVATQAENYLTACEDVGAIVSGKWMGEIEPVLDAEIELTSAVARAFTAIGITKPKLSQKKLLDLQNPETYLIRNLLVKAVMKVDMANRSLFSSAVTASQLDAQYKAWLDIVEGELHVRPLLYSSKWMLAYAGSPAWVKDYKGWWAQYPYSPDAQDEPAYLPINAETWWLWQYSDKGELQGFTGDVNVFNGSENEWAYIYGGEYGQTPPTGETMNKVTVLWDAGANLRPAPNVNNTPIKVLPDNYITETAGNETTDASGNRWIKLTKEGGYIATFFGGTLRAKVEAIVPPSSNPVAEVKFTASDGTVYAGSVELKPQ